MFTMNTRTHERAAHMAALGALCGNAIIVNRVTDEELDELRETREAIGARLRVVNNQCKSIQGRADAEKRDLTPAEAGKLDSLMAEFEGLEREARAVANEISVAEIEQRDSTPQPRVTSPNRLGGSPNVHMGGQARRSPIGRGTGKFDDVFAGRKLEDPYADRFESFGEFALAVWGGRDQRLIQNATMVTTEGAAGGFLVPISYFGELLDASLQQEVIRPLATVIPMASKSGVAPVFDYADGTSGKRAGLQLLWGPEATSLTEQRGKVREIGLEAKKASIFCRVSQELASDVPMFDRQLGAAMVAALAEGLDIAFMSGTGAGMPLGIINAPNAIVVSKEGSQAANTILLQNVTKMFARLAPKSYSRAVWLIHPTTIPALLTLAVVVQNVAATENVGGSTAGAVTVDASGQIRIFGRPTIVTDACAALSSQGDIALVDLAKYLIGLRADAVIAKDESRYFDSDEIAFKLTIRVDGQPADKEAAKLRDGTNTVSSSVLLQAR